MRTVSLASLSLLLAAGLSAQQPAARPGPVTLRPAVYDTGMFAHLALPPGNLVRTADGRPGPGYWQQKVSYSITATLDTAANRLSGHERITYRNNSPVPLRHLYLQLDQNLFKKGSTGSLLFPAGSRFGGAHA